MRHKSKLHKEMKNLNSEFRNLENRKNTQLSQSHIKWSYGNVFSFKKLKNHHQRSACCKHLCVRDTKKRNNLNRNQSIKKSLSNIRVTIKHFQDICKPLPKYSCAVCLKVLFRKQMCKLSADKYSDEEQIQPCLKIMSFDKSDLLFLYDL